MRRSLMHTLREVRGGIGRLVDIAINHDPEALAMHAANHPQTRHLCESVWDVNPREACAGQPVGLAWFSPDCKHFSKAKGGKPVEKKIMGLAWVAVRWAAGERRHGSGHFHFGNNHSNTEGWT